MPSITSSSIPETNVSQRFDAPLPSTTPPELGTTPRPYRAGLTPLPSHLRPHCLAKDRLRLWLPSDNTPRVISVPDTPSSAPITDKQLNRILEVMGASWADRTKESYGSGLLVYHVYCDIHNIPEHQRCPISITLLLSFLSGCAGTYSGSAISNYAAGLRAWHLLHGHPWKISSDELKSILEGASRLAPPSSKRPKRDPFEVHTLLRFLTYLDISEHRDAAIYACIVTAFYCVARLGEFTVPAITKFDPTKHITRANVSHLRDPNGIHIIKFRLPSTKCAPEGEDTHCTPLNCLSDPLRALNNHLALNPAPPNAHLFTWKHPESGLRPLSRTEVTKRIANIAATHNMPNLKGHSLRIGGTLHYLLRGTPFDVVKSMGRWAGDSFTLYLRQHAVILAPYLTDRPDILDRVTRYTMPPVR